jgi:glycosyltransferase involved in cell wall biosynthesis
VRVAFDARALQTVARHRGIGRYARNLLAAWHAAPPEGIEFTLLRLRNFAAPDAQPLPRHRDLPSWRLRRPELSMLALDAPLLAVELYGRCDVYHSLQLSLPLLRRFPAVVTVHDLAPLRWPDAYLATPYAALGHRLQYALARRADAVIAPSDATRVDVIERLGVDPERVHVIPEAVDPSFAPPPREAALALVRERLGLSAPYVLYVGQFDPRKNMPALAAAFRAAAERHGDLRLVVAGELGKLAPFLWHALDAARAPRDRVVAPGYVEDGTLAALYAGAEALVHPALLEGFGLTPLESMAAGTPVVAFDAPGVSEIVADAGVLVPLNDAAALADALLALLADPARRERLSRAGRDRARVFSWSDAAARTAGVYRSVAPRPIH